MSELIDREAAISKIEPWLYSEGRGESELNMLRAVIAELKSLPAAPRWVRCEDKTPENNDAVNVVYVNRNPPSYYADIKDKPFVATAHYHGGRWYWYSSTCQDYLNEYGRCEMDEVDKDIEVLYWMPLPSPPVNKMFTK